MSVSFLNGRESQSAITATTTGSPIDVSGYKDLIISTKFGTCTGSTNTGSLKIQTSNDNSTWHDLIIIWSHADVSDASTDSYLDIIPNHTAAITEATPATAIGFGRYIRFIFTGTGTYAATYTIEWLAKD
jgi:hypothetical protein